MGAVTVTDGSGTCKSIVFSGPPLRVDQLSGWPCSAWAVWLNLTLQRGPTIMNCSMEQKW